MSVNVVSGQKRARSGTITINTAPKSAPASKRPRVVPGMTRTTGFYGRFGQNAKAAGNKPELKFFDTTLAFVIDATGEVPATGQLNLIPQGDTESTRDGRSATIKSIQIRGMIKADFGAAANPFGVTYMYLVLDKQANGAAAAVSDVLTNATMTNGMFNLENSARFVILKKWVHDWTPQAGATTAFGAVARHVEFYKKVDIPITWSSTTGAITEIRSNNLFLIAGASSSALDDLVGFNGVCRLRFQG